MGVYHRLRCLAGSAGLVFECADGCGRRVGVEHPSGRIVVIDRGDPSALHRGGSDDVVLAAPVANQP